MLSTPKYVITVASNTELQDKHYYSRLWMAARNLKIPRRLWLDQIAGAFLADDLHIVMPCGAPYEIPLVDEIFGDDPDMRWLSYYLRPDPTQQRPASYSRKLERLRMIDLYFRIRHPRIAAHFKR